MEFRSTREILLVAEIPARRSQERQELA